MVARVFQVLLRPEVWSLLLGVAAFLGLTWFLRGAPFGQAADEEADPEAPRAAHRDRVVALVVAGLLLIAAGGLVAVVYGIPWSIPLFVAGIVLTGRVVARNRQYQHASPSMRRAVAFGDAALTACLFGGILVIANLLAFRYGGRPIDLTREGTFSLSSLTRNQLRTLEKPVKFTVIAADAVTPRITRLLDLYRAENPDKIQVERLDPYADPTALDTIAKRAPDLALNPRGGAILVEYGEGETADRQVVQGLDLFELPNADPSRPRPDRLESRFRGEDVLTSTLVRLREGKRSVVAVTTGHGERSIQQSEAQQPGIGILAGRLQMLGLEVVELNPGRQEIPEATEVVVIAGPTAPFAPEEIDRLNVFLRRGGRILIWLDNEKPTGLEALLRSFNVEVGAGIMVDPELNYERRAQIIKAPILEGPNLQPIVASLTNRFLLLPIAAPLKIVGAQPGLSGPPNPAYLAEELLRSGPNSWAESAPSSPPIRRDEKDVAGPLPIALTVRDRPKAGSKQEGTPRLVVVGSRYVADNLFVASDPTNLDFLVNAVQWLRGREDGQGIAPKTHVALTLTADPNLKNKLLLVPTLIAIGVISTLGIATFLARRS